VWSVGDGRTTKNVPSAAGNKKQTKCLAKSSTKAREAIKVRNLAGTGRIALLLLTLKRLVGREGEATGGGGGT
jgi:hypothetical protein